MRILSKPDRNATAAAMGSIPAAIVNLIADARVARLAVGRGDAWIGSFEQAFEPPVPLEEAVLVQACDALRDKRVPDGAKLLSRYVRERELRIFAAVVTQFPALVELANHGRGETAA